MESRNLLKHLLEISPDAVIATDSQFRIAAFSGGAEAAFGYSASEILGRDVGELIPERHREAHSRHVLAFTHAEPPRMKMRERQGITALRKDGSEFPAEASIARIDASGGPVFIAILRDVTLQKNAERVLVEAKDRAVAEARAKSDFLADLGHEIRTPLNGLIGLASVLRDGDLPDRERELARLIEESARALSRLSDEILSLSRVEAGRLQVQPTPVRLSTLIRSTHDIFRLANRNPDVACKIALAPTLDGLFLIDEGKLRQVLANLLSNALKFTARGAIELVARLEAAPAGAESGEVLHISVRDTGSGFGAETASRLFNRFEQGPRSAAAYGGSGLGLSIVKSLVELMGGEVSASSNDGEGAIFRVRLPAYRLGPGEGSEADLPTAPPPKAVETAREGLRILLAEDNGTNRIVVQRILETLSADIICAEDGVEAVQAFGGGGFDLVLMDVQMPRLDGIGAIRKIRALEEASGASPSPICVMTAHASTETRDLALDAGADAFLAKPIEPKALLEVVVGLVEQDPAAPAAGGPAPTGLAS